MFKVSFQHASQYCSSMDLETLQRRQRGFARMVIICYYCQGAGQSLMSLQIHLVKCLVVCQVTKLGREGKWQPALLVLDEVPWRVRDKIWTEMHNVLNLNVCDIHAENKVDYSSKTKWSEATLTEIHDQWWLTYIKCIQYIPWISCISIQRNDFAQFSQFESCSSCGLCALQQRLAMVDFSTLFFAMQQWVAHGLDLYSWQWCHMYFVQYHFFFESDSNSV